MSFAFLTASKIHMVIAALMGLLGTVALAMAAHMGGANSLQTAGQFLLFHAPAIIAVTVARRLHLMPMRWGANAVSVLILGVALFCGDLTLRVLASTSLFPMAAPVGGGLIMLGWAGLAICSAVSKNVRLN